MCLMMHACLHKTPLATLWTIYGRTCYSLTRVTETIRLSAPSPSQTFICHTFLIHRPNVVSPGAEGHDDSDRRRQQRHRVSGGVGGGRHEQRPLAGPAGSQGSFKAPFFPPPAQMHFIFTAGVSPSCKTFFTALECLSFVLGLLPVCEAHYADSVLQGVVMSSLVQALHH